MATHSSVLAWRIPGMAEPGGLPSRRSHRVGHDWSDLAAAAAAIILLYQPEGGIGNSEVSVLYYLSLCHLPLFFFFCISHHIWGFPGGSDGKASACNVEDPGSIPGSGRSPGEENGNPLQYSCLENSMDEGAWWVTQSMGLQRVGHDWVTSLTFIHLTSICGMPIMH